MWGVCPVLGAVGQWSARSSHGWLRTGTHVSAESVILLDKMIQAGSYNMAFYRVKTGQTELPRRKYALYRRQ